MTFEIEKRDLVALLSKTLNIVEKKTTMPILLNVLLEAHENSVKVSATDLEVSLTDSVKALVKTPGNIAFNAKNVFEIAKELPEGLIHLEKKENNWLEIKQGKFRSKIVGVNPEEFPVFPAAQTDNSISLTSVVLKEMIDKTIYSVSQDETRYHLNGVYFEIQKPNKLVMVAIDGHRLCMVTREHSDLKDPFPHGVIIPKKGLYEIKKLLDDSQDNIQLLIEGSQIILKKNETNLMIRLIEGKYPNYDQFIPKNLTKKVLVNRNVFVSSLKRVSLLVNQKSKAIIFNISKGKIEIQSHNPDLGDAKEEIEAIYDGEDIKIAYNSKFITDIFNAITDETVEINLKDNLSPGIIQPQKDKNYICVVMPMRI
ncbi:MAG TPA: DNA polymerase III subunit beta [Pseudobdellovibrionaceae bacterium]|nr:DNA polymerase III subunit beta [Pseudobdellovibrionaceae bacterium]